MSLTFTLDGKTIPFTEGQTIIQAASAAGVFIPHLCYHPEFKPHGSCKLCTVKVNGRHTASCTMRASPGMVVESETEEINAERRAHGLPAFKLSAKLDKAAQGHACDNARRRYMDGMDGDIQELDKLVDEMLTYARLEQGAPALNYQDVDLTSLLDKVAGELQESLERNVGQAVTLGMLRRT